MTVGSVIAVAAAFGMARFAAATLVSAVAVRLVMMVVIAIVVVIMVIASAVGRIAPRNLNTRNGAQCHGGASENLKEDRFHATKQL
jgi:hypothetical protein